MIKNFFAILFILAAILSAALFTRNLYAQTNSQKVRVYYFYPSDVAPNQQAIDAINPVMQKVQKWYGDKLGTNKTFYLEPVQVVKGPRSTAEYGVGTDIWYRVMSDLNVGCSSIYTTVIFVSNSIPFQGGGSCSGFYRADQGGIAMLVETTALSTDGNSPGVVAHELGHALTLEHPQNCDTSWPSYCDQTVMWSWWTWPSAGLLDIPEAPEKTALNKSPWFWYSLSPDTAAPTVSITQPSNGATVTGTTNVAADASDNVGVTRVEFAVDNIIQATDSASPFSFAWNTQKFINGTHSLKAAAFDASANTTLASISVNVSNAPDSTPPTVSITSPSEGSNLKGRWANIEASVSDNVGVARVEFYVDNIRYSTQLYSPFFYKFDLKKLSGGSHTIKVMAYDGTGNSNSAQVTISK